MNQTALPKKVELTKQDFDNINDWEEQFMLNRGCPIAKALQRAGYTNASVDVEGFYNCKSNEFYYKFKTYYGISEINRMRLQILKKEQVFIKIE